MFVAGQRDTCLQFQFDSTFTDRLSLHSAGGKLFHSAGLWSCPADVCIVVWSPDALWDFTEHYQSTVTLQRSQQTPVNQLLLLLLLLLLLQGVVVTLSLIHI